LPTIRVCSEKEGLHLDYDFLCCIIGCLLLLISWFAAFCLQSIGSYQKMYLSSNCLNLSCPKLYSHCLNDITTSFHELSEEDQYEMFNLVRNDITKGQDYIDCVLPRMNILKEFPKNSLEFQKLEDLIKEQNNLNAKKKKPSNEEEVTWSPMHEAVKEGKYGLWIFFNFLGGEAGTLNGHAKSSIQMIIAAAEENQEENTKKKNILENFNPFVKWWVNRSTKKYGSGAMHNAAKLGDPILLEMIIENGYDVNQ
jgi:hypothetical protein